VFEKRVLRRIFEPKRDEVTGEWRKLHTEELNVLYFLPTIVRVVKSRTKFAEYWNCSNYIPKIIHVPCNKLIHSSNNFRFNPESTVALSFLMDKGVLFSFLE
jgi:hypothetical protein